MKSRFWKSASAALFATLTVLAASNTSAKDASELNDLEIAHVAYTAGNIDIRYAHLAMAKSDNEQVRKFAALMLQDHKAVNDQAVALITKLGIQPLDNDVSQTLVENSRVLIKEMSLLEGDAFDRKYASNEHAYHKFVNGALEGVFIPNAKNGELKNLLKAGLKVFKVHEGHAEMMSESVGN